MSDDQKFTPKPNAFASLAGRTMKTGSTLAKPAAGTGISTRSDRSQHASPVSHRQLSPGPFYTGIGSRTAPTAILATFREVASRLEAEGWTLRSGGAPGADSAFEESVTDLTHAEIYVPWSDFEGRKHGIRPSSRIWDQAKAMAGTIHPVFDRLKASEQSLHTRNVFEVCGTDIDDKSRHSSFVLCWTQDGSETTAETGRGTGGTRTAIVLAANLGIPVINFAREGAAQRLNDLLEQLRSRSVDRPAGDRQGI